MTETALVVELASDTDADSVNPINPNGEMNSPSGSKKERHR